VLHLLRFASKEIRVTALFPHQPRSNLPNQYISKKKKTPPIITCARKDSSDRWSSPPLWRLPATRSSRRQSLKVLRWALGAVQLASVVFQLASPSANDKYLTFKYKPTQFLNDIDPLRYLNDRDSPIIPLYYLNIIRSSWHKYTYSSVAAA